MKVSIIGATGATGSKLLSLVLDDKDVKHTDIYVRREVELSEDKLNVNIIDFSKPEQWRDLVAGDVFFSCLGTTMKAAGSKEKFREIDFEYQYEFAKAAKENGVKTYVLISADSASSDSLFFYNKVKGELEDAVRKLDFEKLIIMCPPILERENSDRTTEVWAAKAIQFLNGFGILKSQKPLPTETLAKTMISAVKELNIGYHRLNPKKIWGFVDEEIIG